MGLRFTDKSIAGLTCPPGRKDVLLFDDTLAGFGCRVTDKGTKVFLAQYNLGPVKRRMVIGEYGELTLRQARDRALSILGLVKAGRDPYGERKAEVARLAAGAMAARQRATENSFTLSSLIDAWVVDRGKAGKRQSYLDQAISSLRKHLADYLRRPASSLTESDAARRIEQVEVDSGPIAANRLLAYARGVYGRGVQKKLVAVNPFAELEPVAAEKSRERVLNDEEIGAVWRAAGSLPAPYGDVVRLLLLTGQRRTEAAGLRWDELSPDLMTWLLPSPRAKNDAAHIIALAPAAREILMAQGQLADCPFVFPGKTGRAVVAFGLAKRLLDAAVVAEGLVKPAPWVLHDFRRSMATWMASAGIPSDVADRILNHREGRARGVKEVYQRYDFSSERKRALEAWASHVLVCAERTEVAENVVRLRA